MYRQRTEMAWLLPLVVLSISCVSAIQAEAKTKNSSTTPATEERLSVLSQQQNFTDINSLLRDLSVQLAELKVEVKHLQKQNEEQSTTLKDFEQHKSGLEKLQQHAKLQQQNYRTLTEEVLDIKSNRNFFINQVAALREDTQVKKVAFYASLLASGFGPTGPFNKGRILIFRNLIVNIGRAYDRVTGVFTAPVKGAYHFEFHIYGQGHALQYAAASLMKNDQQICVAYEHQGSNSFQASNGATLLLERRDRVHLRQWINTRIFDNEFHPTTFSGHLLFTM